MGNLPFAEPYRGAWYNFVVSIQEVFHQVLNVVTVIWRFVNMPLEEIIDGANSPIIFGDFLTWLTTEFLELFNIDPSTFTLLDVILSNLILLIVFVIVLKGLISLVRIFGDNG